MTSDPPSPLNLQLAWDRVKLEHAYGFVRHPFERAIVETDLQSWLSGLATSVEAGTYEPEPITLCEVPKVKRAVRPGAILTLADPVPVNAFLGQVEREGEWVSARPRDGCALTGDTTVPPQPRPQTTVRGLGAEELPEQIAVCGSDNRMRGAGGRLVVEAADNCDRDTVDLAHHQFSR
jgi:hypothetical protein